MAAISRKTISRKKSKRDLNERDVTKTRAKKTKKKITKSTRGGRRVGAGAPFSLFALRKGDALQIVIGDGPRTNASVYAVSKDAVVLQSALGLIIIRSADAEKTGGVATIAAEETKETP